MDDSIHVIGLMGEEFLPDLPEVTSLYNVSFSSDGTLCLVNGSEKTVIYTIDCRKMTEDGYRFYLSANGIWLTKSVPPQYLRKTDNE